MVKSSLGNMYRRFSPCKNTLRRGETAHPTRPVLIFVTYDALNGEIMSYIELCGEDMSNWTQEMISRKIRELECAKESAYRVFIDDMADMDRQIDYLQTLISNHGVFDG